MELKIQAWTRVTTENINNGEQETYLLVPHEYANPSSGRISIQSPIGRGLAGLSVGDIGEIPLPGEPERIRVKAASLDPGNKGG